MECIPQASESVLATHANGKAKAITEVVVEGVVGPETDSTSSRTSASFEDGSAHKIVGDETNFKEDSLVLLIVNRVVGECLTHRVEHWMRGNGAASAPIPNDIRTTNAGGKHHIPDNSRGKSENVLGGHID